MAQAESPASTVSERQMPPFMNAFMAALLRSPLHGLMSKNLMLLTVTGRKSGKQYTIPVGYARSGNRLDVFTHSRTWWRNLVGGAPVTMHLQGRKVRGMANVVADDKAAIAAALMRYLEAVPMAAGAFNTRMENGKPVAADVERDAQRAVWIQIDLAE